MFKSLFGLVSDVARIAVTPVELMADAVRTVTEPLADAVEDVADSVKDVLK